MPATVPVQPIADELPAIFRHYPDTLLRLDGTGRITDFHPGKDGSPFAQGQSILGCMLSDLLPLPNGDSLKDLVDSALAGESVTVESRLSDTSSVAPIATILEARIFAYGPQGILAIIRDVTNSQKAEATLEVLVRGTAHLTGKPFFESLVSLLSNALNVRNVLVSELIEGETARLRTIAHSQSGSAAELMEYDIAGTPCEKVFGKQLQAYYGNLADKFPLDPILQTMHMECYIGAPIFSSDGRPLGILAVMSDNIPPSWIAKEPLLTILAARCGAELERQRAVEAVHRQQLKLAHTGRLATMGELCGGIVHEVRQPLYSIANFAMACRNLIAEKGTVSDSSQAADLSKWLDSIGKATSSAQQIIGRLHRFLQRQDHSRSTLNLNEVVEEVLSLLEFEFQTRLICLDCDLQARQEVVANRVQLQQVLVNLIYNACEALESNSPKNRHISIFTTQHHDIIEVCIHDNGPGLTNEAAAELFEPFYTSKEEGLGLGMTISKSIIEAHHGKIWFELPSGPGATFHFTLPLHEGN